MDEKEQNDKEDATFGELKGLAVILKSGNEEESSNNKKSNDVLADIAKTMSMQLGISRQSAKSEAKSKLNEGRQGDGPASDNPYAPDPPEKEKNSIFSSFAKSKKRGEEDAEGFDILDAAGISVLVEKFYKVMSLLRLTIIPAIVPFIPLILGIAAAITAVVSGLMVAFDYFNSKEGSLGEKIYAAIEGFFIGLTNVITYPLDWIKDAVSGLFKSILGEDNFLSRILDSFSFVDDVHNFIRALFQFFEDLWEFISPLFSFLGTALEIAFFPLTFALETIFKGIEMIAGWFLKAANWITKWILPDAPDEEFVSQTNQEERDGRRKARDSGLYDKTGVFGKSKVDESKIGSATADQLQAIVSDNDLSDEQMKLVVDQLKLLTDSDATPRGDAGDLGNAIKSKRPAMDAGEEADAKVKAAESKRIRDEVLAGSTPEEIEALKAEMGIESDKKNTGFFARLFGTDEKPEKPEKLARIKAEMGISTAAKTYAGSVGSTDFSSMSPEEQSAYDEFKQIPEGIRRAEPHIQQRRTNPYSMALRSKVATRKELRSYQANPLLEAPTGGSAVNQGQALESGTNRMANAKSKQQNSAPIVVSTPNNSQTTTNNVSNTTSGGGASPIDTHDPFSKYAPLGTSNW
jgi:hypothetical protein